MHDDLPTAYNHKEHEQALYLMWEKAGAFQPQIKSQKTKNKKQNSKSDLLEFDACDLDLPYFSMVMPPPNANGSLHIGHAVFVTLEDIMVRYHRMKGDCTLWLPGADHAGFETQVVYQKKLEKEGRNWFTIPRDELYKEIKAFTLANKETMENQLRSLGASCDWTREKFTLDDDIVKIVYQTFKELYDDGLVYRDARIINWCTKHQTTLSDLEVKHEDRESELYEIHYGDITVATTRPETMFGDVAVAVNPTDKRYKNLIGKTVIQPLTNRELPVIADDMVALDFGTGALKITPAHDGTDYEIGKKHGLEMDHQVFDFFGKLVGEWVPQEYQGINIQDARLKVVENLENLGLLTRKPYNNSVATCYKCGRVIEPMILPQWFIKMKSQITNNKSQNYGKSLQDLGIEAVKNGEVTFVTKKFEKIYLHWLSNLRDWNISRQIVWGIQIPAWYCSKSVSGNKPARHASQGDAGGYQVVGKENKYVDTPNTKYLIPNTSPCQPIITAGEKPKKCPTCGDTNLTQDPDVFDTWFSSGQWTFAPLQAQKTSKGNGNDACIVKGLTSDVTEYRNGLLNRQPNTDFDLFYPTTVMETGHDIIFFWVARMIMLGKYKTGKAPFTHVYLHGLVRDKDRQKMSKSKGNVVDPLGVIDQYGADALRMALVFGASAGNDIVISEEKIKGMRNFSNKVWNVGRYVIAQSQKSKVKSQNDISKIKNKTEADKMILKQLEKTEKSVIKDIESFRFHDAAQTLYQFIWHDFADIYIETSKKQLDDPKTNIFTFYILHFTLTTALRLLHPFMPFVTEAVWQEMYKRGLVKPRMLIHDFDLLDK